MVSALELGADDYITQVRQDELGDLADMNASLSASSCSRSLPRGMAGDLDCA